MRHLTRTAVLASLLTLPAAAGGLHQEWVPRDAIWVGHLDFEALTSSTLFRFVEQQATHDGADIDIDWDELDEMRTKYGIDPLRDLLSVTAFGLSADEDEGTFLVHTTSALDGAIAKLRAEKPEVFDLDSGNYRLLAWSGHDSGFAYVRNVGNERVLMVSHDEQALIDAIDVAEGHRPNLRAGGAQALQAQPSAGAFASIAVAGGLQALDWDHESPLAQSARTLRFEVGESGGNLFANGNVEVDDVQAARDMVDTARGLIAMARLVGGNSPEMQSVLPLLNSIRIEEQGTLVHASVSIPIDIITALIEEHHGGGEHHHDDHDDAEPVKKSRRRAL